MSRRKIKGRKPPGPYYWIPRHVHRSADYRRLTGYSVKLLNAITYQFNGRNNGDMTTAWKVMKEQHGFNSRTTLTRCIRELLTANLVYKTRQGGLHHGPTLYALTWMPIDDCNGKLDSRPTKLPLRQEWDTKKLTAPKTKKMKQETVIQFAQRKEKMVG